jgi:hypothetical protein
MRLAFLTSAILLTSTKDFSNITAAKVFPQEIGDLGDWSTRKNIKHDPKLLHEKDISSQLLAE